MTPHTPEGTVGRLTREQIELLRKVLCDFGGSVVSKTTANILCDMALRPDSSGEASGWLIENGKDAPDTLYRYIEQGLPAWTPDVNKAIRFARRADAEMFAAEDEDAWRIAEHVWHTLPTLPAAEGWVSVKERLPDECFVLVCWEDGDIEQMHASAVETYTHRLVPTGQIVTHWQPLPAPPAAGDV